MDNGNEGGKRVVEEVTIHQKETLKEIERHSVFEVEMEMMDRLTMYETVRNQINSKSLGCSFRRRFLLSADVIS